MTGRREKYAHRFMSDAELVEMRNSYQRVADKYEAEARRVDAMLEARQPVPSPTPSELWIPGITLEAARGIPHTQPPSNRPAEQFDVTMAPSHA